MATRNSAIMVDAKLAAAYNAAPRTKQKQVLSALRQALQEPQPDKAQELRLSQEETELFLRINRYLSPEKQRRYDELRARREAETLTETEHAELLHFVAEIQEIWADRLQALIELAKLRRISPRALMKQLGIEPRPDAD